MEILDLRQGQLTRVSVSGKVDAVTAPDFESAFSEVIGWGEVNFLVDLSRLENISSAGLRAILAVANVLKERRGEPVFVGLHDRVHDSFNISGLYSSSGYTGVKTKSIRRHRSAAGRPLS